jgi:hypothetical protein
VGTIDPVKQLQALVRTYETAVVQAARDEGSRAQTFGEALLDLPRDVANELHASFKMQADALRAEITGGKE